MGSFHIKAQALRKSQLDPATALQLFEPRTDQDDRPSDGAVKQARAGWRQSDVRRLISAAEEAELASYRVEIAPDGTLSIIVGCPADTAPGPALFRDS